MATKKTAKKRASKAPAKKATKKRASKAPAKKATKKRASEAPAKKRASKTPAKKAATKRNPRPTVPAKPRAKKKAKAAPASAPAAASAPVPVPVAAPAPAPSRPPRTERAASSHPPSYLEDLPHNPSELVAGLFQVVRGAAKDLKTLVAQAIAMSQDKDDRRKR